MLVDGARAAVEREDLSSYTAHRRPSALAMVRWPTIAVRSGRCVECCALRVVDSHLHVANIFSGDRVELPTSELHSRLRNFSVPELNRALEAMARDGATLFSLLE